MKEEISSHITQSIDVLIQYKKGQLSLSQAEMLFGNMTGLNSDIATKFLKGMKRDNVVKFSGLKSSK